MPVRCRSSSYFMGKVAIGKVRYLLNIVFKHLGVRVTSFPLVKFLVGRSLAHIKSIV